MNWRKNKQDYYTPEKPIIFGHRGSPTYKTENTIGSFKKALDQGVDGLELDVRTTKDKKVVIFHDSNLLRLAGIKKRIRDMSYDNLKLIKIKNGQKIPLLKEIKPLLPRAKVLNIEIKSDSFYRGFSSVDPVLRFIKENRIEKKCIVSCFNPLVLLKIKFKNPETILGYLYNRRVPFHTWHNFVWINIVKPENLHMHSSQLNSWVVRWARRKNLKINSYTINSKKIYKSISVDGVFTDNIEYIK